MRLLYLILSLALLALGALHTAVALRRLTPLTGAGVWFLAGGNAMLLTAALNLLNRKYGSRAAPGIRPTAFAANLVMLASSILGGIATHAAPAQLAIVLSITGVLTLLSGFRRALC